MGKENDIIVNEKTTKATVKASGAVVRLDTLKKGKSIDKKLSTIARSLVEKLLPYFITKDYVCPEITLMEKGGSQSILLNDYFSNELSAVIKEMSAENDGFSLKASNGERAFCVRVFKFYSPKSQRSRISLVAHKREVSGSAIHNYIPEFVDEFYDKGAGKNYTQISRDY